MLKNLYLVVHILCVSIWFGANIVLAFVSPRMANASAEVRRFWAQTQGAMARVLYNVAGVGVLLTGILLVVSSDGEFEFKNAFVSVGFLAVVVGAGLGMAVFGPGSRQLDAAIERGDEAQERAINNKLAMFGIIDSLVLIVTVVAMVAKWGLGN